MSPSYIISFLMLSQHLNQTVKKFPRCRNLHPKTMKPRVPESRNRNGNWLHRSKISRRGKRTRVCSNRRSKQRIGSKVWKKARWRAVTPSPCYRRLRVTERPMVSRNGCSEESDAPTCARLSSGDISGLPRDILMDSVDRHSVLLLTLSGKQRKFPLNWSRVIVSRNL
jgi:hypothetical protein